MTDLFVIGTEDPAFEAFEYEGIRVGETALDAETTWDNIEWSRSLTPFEAALNGLVTQNVTVYRLVPVGKIDEIERADLD